MSVVFPEPHGPTTPTSILLTVMDELVQAVRAAEDGQFVVPIQDETVGGMKFGFFSLTDNDHTDNVSVFHLSNCLTVQFGPRG